MMEKYKSRNIFLNMFSRNNPHPHWWWFDEDEKKIKKLKNNKFIWPNRRNYDVIIVTCSINEDLLRYVSIKIKKNDF